MHQRATMLILATSLLPLPAAGPAWAGDDFDAEPRTCINVRAIKRTRIVDDFNVLFVMRNNAIYHNILPRKCNGLHRESRFSYNLTSNNLCRHNSIRVPLHASNDHSDVRLCRLGVFHPVAQADLPQVIDWLNRPPRAKLPPPAVPEVIVEEDEKTAEAEPAEN